nr:MAG TPA: 40S ribosomal protein S1-A [Caudoviricetes sp.]
MLANIGIDYETNYFYPFCRICGHSALLRSKSE